MEQDQTTYVSSPEHARIQATQREVNEVAGIMKDTTNKMLDRDGKLKDLELSAQSMEVGANQFHLSARRIRHKYWWQNMKMWILLIIVGIVISGIIVFSITQ